MWKEKANISFKNVQNRADYGEGGLRSPWDNSGEKLTLVGGVSWNWYAWNLIIDNIVNHSTENKMFLKMWCVRNTLLHIIEFLKGDKLK